MECAVCHRIPSPDVGPQLLNLVSPRRGPFCHRWPISYTSAQMCVYAHSAPVPTPPKPGGRCSQTDSSSSLPRQAEMLVRATPSGDNSGLTEIAKEMFLPGPQRFKEKVLLATEATTQWLGLFRGRLMQRASWTLAFQKVGLTTF